MVTECYIASCFIGEVARCAVVIADDVRLKEVKTIRHQVSWEVKEPWIYSVTSVWPLLKILVCP